jgi:hypothetical protein
VPLLPHQHHLFVPWVVLAVVVVVPYQYNHSVAHAARWCAGGVWARSDLLLAAPLLLHAVGGRAPQKEKLSGVVGRRFH